jgi:NAD-dependent SIR2 family protein deacetylase
MALESGYARAAEEVRRAGALVVSAGAGMGVDSGLPDFRGDRGFWKAYPPYERLGLSFVDAANPIHFDDDPPFGWGFYGHRTNLYRTTKPHGGFGILRSWAARYRLPAFVVTSNVDGQFQKAGFPDERVLEVHGSIHHLQCTTPCCEAIWGNDGTFEIDEATMRSRQVPRCPRCRAVARPNILMFSDSAWLDRRTSAQRARFEAFLDEVSGARLLVLELGAGTGVPTIRLTSERLARRGDAVLVRVNPREADAPPQAHQIAAGALEALAGIDAALDAG